MANDRGDSEEVTFIVMPRGGAAGMAQGALRSFALLASARNVRIRQSSGPAERPRRLLISGTRADVALLRRDAEQDFWFEEDTPLTPLRDT